MQVDDLKSYATLGVNPKAMAKTVVSVVADMTYLHGFLHCDPHAGNLLVRVGPTGQHQLVLLDHGMYRRLDPQFRYAYCMLWKSFVTNDVQLLQRAAELLNVPEHFEASHPPCSACV